MSERCDRGLPNGKRCKNQPTKWIHLIFQPNDYTIEDWPALVCDSCSSVKGLFVRMGPDRREQYKTEKEATRDETDHQ